MEQEILLSVIVPVYNRENFLPRCLESLVKQTMESIEILVVDDGQIVQRGTHTELVAVPGKYRDFVDVRSQSEGWKIG